MRKRSFKNDKDTKLTYEAMEIPCKKSLKSDEFSIFKKFGGSFFSSNPPSKTEKIMILFEKPEDNFLRYS